MFEIVVVDYVVVVVPRNEHVDPTKRMPDTHTGHSRTVVPILEKSKWVTTPQDPSFCSLVRSVKQQQIEIDLVQAS